MPEDFEAHKPLEDEEENRLVYPPLEVGKRGDSLTVTIPSDLAERMELQKGEGIEFRWDENRGEALMMKEDEDVITFGTRKIRKTKSGSFEITIPVKLAKDKMKVERKKEDRKPVTLVLDKETNIVKIVKGRSLSNL